MAIRTATHVRMAGVNTGGAHEHIEGVCTEDGTFHSREEVVAGLHAGDEWRTSDGHGHAQIKEMEKCKHKGCPLTPYITTHANNKITDNLDNLPRCLP